MSGWSREHIIRHSTTWLCESALRHATTAGDPKLAAPGHDLVKQEPRQRRRHGQSSSSTSRETGRSVRLMKTLPNRCNEFPNKIASKSGFHGAAKRLHFGLRQHGTTSSPQSRFRFSSLGTNSVERKTSWSSERKTSAAVHKP